MSTVLNIMLAISRGMDVPIETLVRVMQVRIAETADVKGVAVTEVRRAIGQMRALSQTRT